MLTPCREFGPAIDWATLRGLIDSKGCVDFQENSKDCYGVVCNKLPFAIGGQQFRKLIVVIPKWGEAQFMPSSRNRK